MLHVQNARMKSSPPISVKNCRQNKNSNPLENQRLPVDFPPRRDALKSIAPLAWNDFSTGKAEARTINIIPQVCADDLATNEDGVRRDARQSPKLPHPLQGRKFRNG